MSAEFAATACRLRPASGVQARRAGAPRRPTLALAFGLAAVGAAVPALLSTAFAPVLGGSWPATRATSTRGEAVVRRVSKYYSNEDRERLARYRKEQRLAQREKPAGAKSTAAPLNYDMLPAIEDIYNRKFTGNSTVDPVGGRKRYTYYVLFKNPLPPLPGKSESGAALKKAILEYIWFLKYKMSCFDVRAEIKRSPINNEKIVTLEYPMREYGEIPRGQKSKQIFNKATLVVFNFVAPVQAGEYITQKIYSDNNILRYMTLGHTRTFRHIGEDNELHL